MSDNHTDIMPRGSAIRTKVLDRTVTLGQRQTIAKCKYDRPRRAAMSVAIVAALAGAGAYSAAATAAASGTAGALPSSLNLSDLNGSTGFVIKGSNENDFSGFSVSTAGDINGDGIDDVIVGAYAASPGGAFAGESYVVFGRNTGFLASLDLSALDGSTGFVINGVSTGDTSGFSVSAAGDINGDGVDDVIIGAYRADPGGNNEAGKSYVVFGRNTGFSASLDLSALDGSNGFVINGIDAFDRSGISVSAAGDINDDGIDDVIIGAPGDFSLTFMPTGESYVVFGRNTGFSASLDLSALNGSDGFVINGIDTFDYSGFSVSGAGDINGDGIDDVIIGASHADPGGNNRAGESYVVFGRSTGFSASLDLAALDGSNGFVINGIDVGSTSGFSVSAAGDTNGDGIDDVIIGGKSGKSHMVFGRDTGFSASLDLSALDGSNGFVINGGGLSGRSVSSAGDINGDGVDDVIIGRPSSVGQSHVVFGRNTGFSASLDLSALNGSDGFVINGIDAGDYSGRSVSSAGDVNGDGINDVIIGARDADPGGNSAAGESYVVFGAPFLLGGSVSGFAGGTGPVLQNNGADDLAIDSNGAFLFMSHFFDQSTYAVSVLSQPTGPNQTCIVSGGNSGNNNGTGVISGASELGIGVNCITSQYTVGGTVFEYGSGTLTLQNNAGELLDLFSNGTFTFAAPLDDGSSFSVTIAQQPNGQTCKVSYGDGVLSGANETDIEVQCDSIFDGGFE